ncbi:MAG: nitrous oxide reductase family maturation protein NosD [Promethearchaeota archaeon]
MKKKNKTRLIIIVLGMVLSILTIFNNNFFTNQEAAMENPNKNNLKGLEYSANFFESFIHIDGNWSDTAIAYPWCSGNGSWVNPYIIENVTIDVNYSPTGCGILINNSKTDYFIIRNCKTYNGTFGISLENTNRGTLTFNNCSNNQAGIKLYAACENNTISGNFASNNSGTGIDIRESCKNNTISRNIASNNAGQGIYLFHYCNHNTISENTINKNGGTGIYIRESCIHNTIFGNIANNNNQNGIFLYRYCENTIISENVIKNNYYRGLYIWHYCKNNTIMRNTLNDNQRGIELIINCENNTISGNTANNNQIYGIYIWNSNYNIISANIANNNYYGIFLTELTNNTTILGNTANYNIAEGIIIWYCNNNTILRNIVKYNGGNGILIQGDSADNVIIENYVYFNSNWAIFLGSYREYVCNNTIISKNVLVSNNQKFLLINGTNTFVSLNHFLKAPPKFTVQLLGQSFSSTEFLVSFNISSQCRGVDVSNISIQMWWDGIFVPSNNITKLGDFLYNISLSPKFVNPGEEPVLLNMTISAVHYSNTYYENYIAVAPPEIVNLLHVEIFEHSYSIQHFNLTIFVSDEAELGINSALIRMWWNGIEVSVDVINLGNGFYFVSLEPLTVLPGEDPILLNMTISVDGYQDKYFETYIAIDPDTLEKDGETSSGEFPIITLIIATSTIAGVIGVAGVSLVLLRRKK